MYKMDKCNLTTTKGYASQHTKLKRVNFSTKTIKMSLSIEQQLSKKM